DVKVRVNLTSGGGYERVAVEARVRRANRPGQPVVRSLRYDLAFGLAESPVGPHDADGRMHPAGREDERSGQAFDGGGIRAAPAVVDVPERVDRAERADSE